MSLPLLLGAVVADFAVTSASAAYVEDYTTGAATATAAALTVADLAVGCLLGGCAALKP